LIPEDIELISRLQKGDIIAFDQIYQKYSGKLYLFGMKYLQSAIDAEELVQSVFLKVWENHKNLKEQLSFKSFLFTIAFNEICKHFRKRHYCRKYIEDVIHLNNNSSRDNEESMYFNNALERIMKIIKSLPEKQRSAFIKGKIEGMPSREIAVEMKLSRGTVDNYISETMKYLRDHLNNEGIMIILFCALFLA